MHSNVNIVQVYISPFDTVAGFDRLATGDTATFANNSLVTIRSWISTHFLGSRNINSRYFLCKSMRNYNAQKIPEQWEQLPLLGPPKLRSIHSIRVDNGVWSLIGFDYRFRGLVTRRLSAMSTALE